MMQICSANLLLMVISVTVKGEILRLPCKTFANFSVVLHGHSLDATYRTLENLDEQMCKTECIIEGQCKSININKDLGICQLNDKSAQNPNDRVKTDAKSGWTYFSTRYDEKHIGELCRATDPCRTGEQCFDTCTCPGYQCIDNDECRTGAHSCHPKANCINTVGSFSCKCNAGFSGDGTVCTDIDECSTGGHGCHPNAICTNNFGSFSCQCNAGFSGDGTVCTDIDECSTGSHGCHPNAICTNNVGSFSCKCNAGFSGDGTVCTDIDECNAGLHNCHHYTGSKCNNTIGGFWCECFPNHLKIGKACLENVAVKKTSSQSSTFTDSQARALAASFGNDGDLSAWWGTSAVTLTEYLPWWQVDLARVVVVIMVRIKVCMYDWDMINPFNVTVVNRETARFSTKFCVTNGRLSNSSIARFNCTILPFGRYVTVFVKRQDQLRIAEVEVYEATNIAYKKPSSHSSTSTIQEIPLVASFGNDGDRTGEWQRCSITLNDILPWWQVDLARQAAVTFIRIKNGATWGTDRINPFDVSVGDDKSNGGRNNTLCVKDGTLASGQTKRFICPSLLLGRYVTVFLNRQEILQVCELEVYEGLTG
ncbi:uncharacterized protein LOC135696328 isoform X2 [Rhopilema esculentum]|uniref:uncharacterized protein LOC135696328 isoform X2 n=1 Tax=Rhopilema esculentum TaxID=499914 RepID=UPI0031DCA7E9